MSINIMEKDIALSSFHLLLQNVDSEEDKKRYNNYNDLYAIRTVRRPRILTKSYNTLEKYFSNNFLMKQKEFGLVSLSMLVTKKLILISMQIKIKKV